MLIGPDLSVSAHANLAEISSNSQYLTPRNHYICWVELVSCFQDGEHALFVLFLDIQNIMSICAMFPGLSLKYFIRNVFLISRRNKKAT